MNDVSRVEREVRVHLEIELARSELDLLQEQLSQARVLWYNDEANRPTAKYDMLWQLGQVLEKLNQQVVEI